MHDWRAISAHPLLAMVRLGDSNLFATISHAEPRVSLFRLDQRSGELVRVRHICLGNTPINELEVTAGEQCQSV